MWIPLSASVDRHLRFPQSVADKAGVTVKSVSLYLKQSPYLHHDTGPGNVPAYHYYLHHSHILYIKNSKDIHLLMSHKTTPFHPNTIFYLITGQCHVYGVADSVLWIPIVEVYS